jgi:threonine dehydratase
VSGRTAAEGLGIPSLAEIEAARELIGDALPPTPLVRLDVDHPGADLWLKLENLQPIGAFKLRGALHAVRSSSDPRLLVDGVWTASAGNMAQGVCWAARQAALRATVVMPEQAPRTKREAVERLGGRIVPVSWERWWRTFEERSYPGLDGLFVHPVADRAVLEGNGTAGLEIFAALDRVDAILVPFGGGGLACGIAAAARGLGRETPVLACEVETAAPLAASLAAGAPTAIDPRPSFVDGIGGKSVLREMWPLVTELISGVRVVSLAAVAGSIRRLAERARVVAEGAGAASVAAALGDPTLEGNVVCVVSGGNIDREVLATILSGGMP